MSKKENQNLEDFKVEALEQRLEMGRWEVCLGNACVEV